MAGSWAAGSWAPRDRGREVAARRPPKRPEAKRVRAASSLFRLLGLSLFGRRLPVEVGRAPLDVAEAAVHHEAPAEEQRDDAPKSPSLSAAQPLISLSAASSSLALATA